MFCFVFWNIPRERENIFASAEIKTKGLSHYCVSIAVRKRGIPLFVPLETNTEICIMCGKSSTVKRKREREKTYVLQPRVELAILASLLEFLLNFLGFLDILLGSILGLSFFLSKGNSVMSLVPGTERGSIDL